MIRRTATRLARCSRSCARLCRAGTVRAAEPDASSPTGWRVNAWVKQGILLGFRWGALSDQSADHGRWPFVDKDTLPLKKFTTAEGVRVVPGGSTIRDGAFLARGVICMPPMYINIGVYVGEGTLVDSHALVGSCAQVGARVHLSAAAQIGGVIEPVGSLPVIIEDDVLVGGNTGVYEGVVVKTRAVIAAGTVITGSTPIYDLPHERIIRPEAGPAPRRARRRRRRAGRAPGHRGSGRRVGPVARDAGDREVPRRSHRHPHRAGTMDSLSLVTLSRTLIDIDSTTGREGDCGRWLAAYLRARGYRVEEQAVSDGRFNVLATLDDAARRVLHALRLRAAVFPEPHHGGRLYGRGACDAKGILAAQVTAAERLRQSGVRDLGMLFVVGRGTG